MTKDVVEVHKNGSLGLLNGQCHGFKNQTGPAGSTGDRCLIRSGSLKKPKKWKNKLKTGNRRFNRQNREPERLNRFWPGSLNHKTHRFCLFFFFPAYVNPKLYFQFFACPSASRTPFAPSAHAGVFLTPMAGFHSHSHRSLPPGHALSISLTVSVSHSHSHSHGDSRSRLRRL